MTELGRIEPDAAEARDHWDVVFAQLSRRRLFRLAVAILALLYGLAIYAPLIANDRPYVLEAVDHAVLGKGGGIAAGPL